MPEAPEQPRVSPLSMTKKERIEAQAVKTKTISSEMSAAYMQRYGKKQK